MLYGSELWGIKARESIEKVHIQACKLFLNVPPHTPNDMMYGELGRFPLYIQAAARCLQIGSDYDDSLYVVIPEKHTICYMDYKKEITKQKLGFTMLNACCVSTDLGMYGCIEKLVTKDGFCIYLKNVLKIASIRVSGHIYLIVNASIFIILLRAHSSVKDI